jgi:Pyruvate/2-oxoacid:ferredoxin oxidoreductase delta subunit
MIDVEDAAVRAGLGEIGYCGMFLTPEYGPRQRMQLILTTAELSPNELLEKQVCTRCREHVKFCPLGAIGAEGEKTVAICGKEMLVASVDYSKCRACKNGANINSDYPAAKPERYGALCTRNCIDFLEKEGRLTNTFHNPFRVRQPWGVVQETRALDPEEI